MFPIGKLPQSILSKLIQQIPIFDDRILLPPGIGMDCSIIQLGNTCLVFKSDPITFASDNIGWYLVQVNANDIATTGAVPRWLLTTWFLPDGKTDEHMVDEIASQINQACAQIGVSIIGGHTEITYGLDRPILAGTMVGEVKKEKLITPQGIRSGNRILLTKSVPIEATALIARELPKRLKGKLSLREIDCAANYIFDPGISVLRDAQLAIANGKVTAMHDPTEGGLAAALWELAEAGQCSIFMDRKKVPVSPLSEKICRAVDIDPLASIASGAMIIAVHDEDSIKVCKTLTEQDLPCKEIGWIEKGKSAVWDISATDTQGYRLLNRPQKDDITKLF